jgi:hypothetical protein
MTLAERIYYTTIAVALVPATVVCIGCGVFAWWRVLRQ